jgi:thioesterase domain-containing protein
MGNDVAWVASSRVFAGTLAAVQRRLEKVVGSRLVVLDQSAREFQRSQAAAQVAAQAMGQLRGDGPVCEDCGGMCV